MLQFLKKKNKIFLLLGLSVLMFAGCAADRSNQSSQPGNVIKKEKEYSVLLPGTYDSKDTAVFLQKNEKEKTLTFYNIEVGKNYTLSYDGTTHFYDKYKDALALSQVEEGTIVDVTFLKDSKKLNTLQISPQAWSNSGINRFQIDEGRKDITIGSDIFKFSDDLVVMQGEKQMTLMDVNTVDVLTVSGIGTSVYSIKIDEGHGYLRLTGDEYFVGGWIEVGQSLIQEITEGMLLTVPQGSYDVEVSNNGSGGTKRVVINENEEVTLDISDLKGETEKTGTVLFTITPSDANAKVYVDGEEVDISGPVTLEYGIHQLMAKAEGYKTSTSYLKVAEESAGISIVLDEEDEDDSDSKDSNKKEENKDSEEESKEEESKQEDKENSVSDNDKESDEKENDKDSDKDKESEDESADNDDEEEESSDDSVSDSDDSVSTDYYKVYIDNPKDTEVYLDGNYVGKTPVSFKKESGIHVITLRRAGYETRSYTVNIDSDERDVSYSFVELEKAN